MNVTRLASAVAFVLSLQADQTGVILQDANGNQLGKAANATSLSGFSSVGSLIHTLPGNWAANAQATAGAASASRASGGAGVRHVCNSVVITAAAAATAQPAIVVNLRDGATGAGTILYTFSLAAPVNSSSFVAVSGLNLVGSPATAMTLEFASATAAGVIGSVDLSGFDTQ